MKSADHEAAARLKNDPVLFCSKVLGLQMHDKFAEICESVRDNQKTNVLGCYSSSKTFGSAALCNWWSSTRYQSVFITTAPTNRQVRDLLWKDIRTQRENAERNGYPLGGIANLQRVDFGAGWYGLGFATNDYNEASFQGFHAKGGVLFVIDEASGISQQVWDAQDKIIISPEDRLLVIGNSSDNLMSPFIKSFKDSRFNKIHISAYDTPNVQQEKQVIKGMVTVEWVNDKKQVWSKERGLHHLFRMYVLAEIVDDLSESNTLIPVSWFQAAVERWRDGKGKTGIKSVGCDIGFKQDASAFAKADGMFVEEIEEYRNLDTAEAEGRIHIFHNQGYRPAVDGIGIGAGVVHRCIEEGLNIIEVIGSAATTATDSTGLIRFPNERSARYWALREAFDPNPLTNPDPISIPDDNELMEDLCGLTWKPIAGGKIQIEPKTEVVKRLGRSPNKGDAVSMLMTARDAGVATATIIKPTEISPLLNGHNKPPQRRFSDLVPRGKRFGR